MLTILNESSTCRLVLIKQVRQIKSNLYFSVQTNVEALPSVN